MKKKLKKILSKLLPKGFFKEKIKLFWYNFKKTKNVKFDVFQDSNSEIIYKTTYNDLVLYTNEGLYNVVPDFDYYQHFYKVKEGDVVLDAGSNVGILGVLFSKKAGKKGKVFCFEPDRFNIKLMKHNFELNPDLEANYQIEELLLWNENTLLDFQEDGTVSSSAIWISDVTKTIKKQAVSIDSWFQNANLQQLDFVKMDIEGAEIEALDGCREVIEKFKPNFAIASYHIVNDEPTYIKLEAFFKEIKYPYKTVKFRGNEIITFAGPSAVN